MHSDFNRMQFLKQNNMLQFIFYTIITNLIKNTYTSILIDHIVKKNNKYKINNKSI